MEQLATPDTAIAGLHASAPTVLPFAPEYEIRAFLLEREHGNVLVYSVPDLAAEQPAIDALGGAERHYLSHRHEAMFLPDAPLAPLFADEREADAVEQPHHVRGTWSRRHLLDDDLEVIPIPGHTPGATAFLWDSGAERILFTGDTLYLGDGEWVAGLLRSSDPDAFVRSLELIRELEFDVLVPWAAGVGQPWHARTDRDDTRRRIDAIVARIRRGEDG